MHAPHLLSSSLSLTSSVVLLSSHLFSLSLSPPPPHLPLCRLPLHRVYPFKGCSTQVFLLQAVMRILTPTIAPTATSTTTAATSTTLATLALAAAALRTSRSSTVVLRNRDVCSSSKGEGGGKGRGGAPLKEGRARSATSST
ncbi:unnamed protein product [Closterium sp. NIES-54]